MGHSHLMLGKIQTLGIEIKKIKGENPCYSLHIHNLASLRESSGFLWEN